MAKSLSEQSKTLIMLYLLVALLFTLVTSDKTIAQQSIAEHTKKLIGNDILYYFGYLKRDRTTVTVGVLFPTGVFYTE